MKLSTSTNPTPTGAVASSVIGCTVTDVTFSVAAKHLVAGRTSSAATFTFKPTFGSAGPANVTLSNPSSFVVSSTPTATHSAAGATLTLTVRYGCRNVCRLLGLHRGRRRT